MAPRNSLFKAALVKKVMGDEFRRKKQAKKQSCVLSVFLQIASKRKSILLSLFHMILLLTNQNMSMPRPILSERRLPRLQGWWDTVVRHYDDNRFKKNFRVTRATFLFLLDAIKIDLQKEVVTELPITRPFVIPGIRHRHSASGIRHLGIDIKYVSWTNRWNRKFYPGGRAMTRLRSRA